MQENVRSLRTVGSELLFTLIFAHLASAHLALQQLDEGLTAVDDGLKCVERNGERWAEAELYRIRGQLLLARGMQDATLVDSCFSQALDVARRLQAKTYELRAASSLAQLWRRQGRDRDAQALLTEAIDAWPEEPQTADLVAARRLRDMT